MAWGCNLGSPRSQHCHDFAKNMQNSGDMHVVQLPFWSSSILCPITLKDMVKYLRQCKDDLLFFIPNGSGYKPLLPIGLIPF